ncbi:MAG TPA: YbjQ family protein [Longimicrobium sp.]|nr:YbjQ family protein [Longimicrobium sp.]
MNRKRMLLTTTSSLDGWTVQEYLGPVSAEVVIGTGLFTEFFSSWTDAFGMESHAHQGKLDLIKQRALAGIEYKALRLGANAVIGLRVDHDEIGAGGKSLLMVTAMGTAVRAHRSGATADPHARSRAGAISAYELGVNRDRARLLQQAEAGKLDLGDARTWDFVVDNKVVELAPHVLKRAVLLQSQFSYNPVERDRAWAPLKDFFQRLEPEQAAEALYAALAGPDVEADFALQVIREAGLLDVPRVMAMLQTGDETVRARVLQVVRADQPFYTPDDISPLQALRDRIPAVFLAAPPVRKKGLLGEKDVWMCVCGEAVDARSTECGTCGRDRHGVPRKWVKPADAIRLLDEKISLLRAQFPEAAALPA